MERNNSFTRRSCSMKAEGATVPLSEGCVDMCRKRERSAEKRDGGFVGMVITFEPPSFSVPDAEAIRSGLRRTGTRGEGVVGSARGTPAGI